MRSATASRVAMARTIGDRWRPARRRGRIDTYGMKNTKAKVGTNSLVLAQRTAKIVSGCDPKERAYILEHTRETEWLRELRERTSNLPGSHMQVPPEQAQFMAFLIELIGATKVVEVGVYTGYSSLAMAMALPKHGQLVAIDKDRETMDVAQEHWNKAGVGAVISPRCGPAKEVLERMLQGGEACSYDMAFIDADKRSYLEYYELCMQLVRPGGIVLVDNTLFYGQVADPSTNTKITKALREFNDFVHRDERVSYSLVPVGDGLTLCRKR